MLIHGLWQYQSLATWRALRHAGVPYFVYPHGMLDPWFKRSYPFKHFKKCCYWPWADFRVLRDASAVLFTTDQERLLARKSFRPYEAREVVVGYGTSSPSSNKDYQLSFFLNHFPHLRGKRIFLFLSRIHPKKGVDILIKAFADVVATDPGLHLVIAGPDHLGMQAALHQLAVSLGVADHITWPGMLCGDLKWGAFRSAELFCLPSHQENFGIAVAEALACGLPVAISDPVNISADVSAAGAGIIHADTYGTTTALRQWIAMSTSDKRAMALRSRMLFLKQFDFGTVAKNLLPLFRQSANTLPP